jgi:N-sulfoglucosamine sulfohydrolase
VRTQRWKYIRRYDDRRRPVLSNCDDGPSKDTWLRDGWRDRYVPPEELYDLVFDPNESHNLVGNPAFDGVLDEMRGRLDRWMRDTDDPLLHGPVPAPPGAELNDPDGLSSWETTWVV